MLSKWLIISYTYIFNYQWGVRMIFLYHIIRRVRGIDQDGARAGRSIQNMAVQRY